MIYLKNSTEKQECFIPKNGAYVGKKTYKEGIEYQKTLIEPITITDNGVYENENGYSPVDVNIPFGGTTITENGIYDTRNGYVAKSYEEIGDYWQMQGGGFVFHLGGAYNNIKMQVLFKPSNEVGEYFPDLIRGIIGSYAEKFYIAEEIENPYKIFACVGDWQSEHIEITNDWHLLSLSKTEFTIDGKVVGILPDDFEVAVTTILLNGLYDTNANNYYYPNLGEYSDVKIWCDDDLLFDCVYFYGGNQSGEYGYLNKIDNQLVTNNWKVANNWLHFGHSSDYKLKNVRALDYVEVSVVSGDVNIVDKVITLTDEDRTSVNALEEGVDGFRNVEVDASILANRRFEEGYQAGVNSGEGGCDLEPLYISPTWDERDENNYVNYTPSEGKDGFDEVHINLQPTYEQGYNDGQANCEGGGETSCTLEHLEVNENGYYEPKAQEFDYLIVRENSAFDTGVKLVENSTIEIYFNTGSNWDNIPTLIGCEDADWDNTTFAVRWFSGSLAIKIGSQEINIPMGTEDETTKFHKLKFGRYEGVWLDDNYIEPFNDTEWILTQNTIYIGAMHNTTNGDANGVWRPWNGYIGDVKIYGEKNGEVEDFTFTCGDFGRWGEYETDGGILPNLMGDGGATFTCCKQYGDKPFDGYSSVSVNIDVEPFKEEGRNEVRNKLQSIDITANGIYSTDDMELIPYIEFDGNSYFDTTIPFGENTKIEVAITKTIYEEDEQAIGVAQYDLLVAETYGAFGIVLGPGLAYGVFGKAKTNNIAFSYEEEQILTFDRNGIKTSFNGGEGGWIDESGLDSSGLYGQTIGLGKIKSVNDGWLNRGLNGCIRYVKIWTDGNDDSTMTLFRPKNMAQGGFGMVNSEGTEYNYVENLGEGTTTFIEEYVKKYGEGWKEINVNVTPKIIDYEGVKFGHSTFTDCPFNIDGRGEYDYMFFDCKNLVNAPIINTPINSAVSMFSDCESLVNGGDYNTSNATDLSGMYGGCDNLQYVGSIDCSSLPNQPIGWGQEAQIFRTSQYAYLTDFGGFINLKQVVNLKGLIALNEQSVINIFNGLYDFVGNNETPNTIQGKITMSRFITDIVEAHKSIAENKGWTITIE